MTISSTSRIVIERRLPTPPMDGDQGPKPRVYPAPDFPFKGCGIPFDTTTQLVEFDNPHLVPWSTSSLLHPRLCFNLKKNATGSYNARRTIALGCHKRHNDHLLNVSYCDRTSPPYSSLGWRPRVKTTGLSCPRLPFQRMAASAA